MGGRFHPSRLRMLQDPQDASDNTVTASQSRPAFTGANGQPLAKRVSRMQVDTDLPCRGAGADQYFQPPIDSGNIGINHQHVYSEIRSGPQQVPVFSNRVKQQCGDTENLSEPHRMPAFDFGSGQPLPPPHPQPVRGRSLFQKLSTSNDQLLLTYLQRRHITTGFLREIDLMLRNHPELAHFAPHFVHNFNSRSPFEAYKFFLTGYTKPARYVPGFLPEGDLVLPRNFVPERLIKLRDEELDEFFRGYDYRYDILEEIDTLVANFCNRITAGLDIRNKDRKLVVYAVWGNPVDAYKYFEYNYQTKWLKHRYLSEHVILDEIPKGDDYTVPKPSIIGPDEGQRSHRMTRLRMARAADEGVDVITVLLDDFVSELAKKGQRRDFIERKRREALDAIEQERQDPRGHDIVDLVMQAADSEKRVYRRPLYPVVPQFTGCTGFEICAAPGNSMIHFHGYGANSTTMQMMGGPVHTADFRNDGFMPISTAGGAGPWVGNGPVGFNTMAAGANGAFTGPGKRRTNGLSVVKKEDSEERKAFREAKRRLERDINREIVARTRCSATVYDQAIKTRRNGETKFVRALTKLAAVEGFMSKMQCDDLRSQFVRRNREKNELAGMKVDLLRLYGDY